MKEFFKSRSYDMVKMFLNQFATSIFGFVLFLAAEKAQNTVLRNVTSIFAVLFYLFLLYTMTWELGFRDKVSVESGRKKSQPLTGGLISLVANLPNFLFAGCILLSRLSSKGALQNIGYIAKTAGYLLEGMYTGVIANTVGGVPLHDRWWMWFLIPLPAILVCTVAYLMGIRDIKFTSYFNVQYPESDREKKRPKKK